MRKQLGKKKQEQKCEGENDVKREEGDVMEGRGLRKKDCCAGKVHWI